MSVVDPNDYAVDTTEIVNNHEISAGTTMGVNKRACPCCSKQFNVERLGPHVKKNHAEFWNALFSIDNLQAALESKDLVPCTVAYADHDQKFLLCLACESVRTTNRDHFKKNGEVHLNQHLEICTKMLSGMKGIKYVPRARSEVEVLKVRLDKFERVAAHCEKNHDNYGALECERDDTILENGRLLKEIEELKDIIKAKIKKEQDMNLRNNEITQCVKLVSDHLIGVYAKKESSLEKCGRLLSRITEQAGYRY